jgi:hypothetical protein
VPNFFIPFRGIGGVVCLFLFSFQSFVALFSFKHTNLKEVNLAKQSLLHAFKQSNLHASLDFNFVSSN